MFYWWLYVWEKNKLCPGVIWVSLVLAVSFRNCAPGWSSLPTPVYKTMRCGAPCLSGSSPSTRMSRSRSGSCTFPSMRSIWWRRSPKKALTALWLPERSVRLGMAWWNHAERVWGGDGGGGGVFFSIKGAFLFHICTCTHACIYAHTHTCACTHTHTHTHTHTNAHTQTHTHTHTLTHSLTHARMHARTHTRKHTQRKKSILVSLFSGVSVIVCEVYCLFSWGSRFSTKNVSRLKI